MPYADIRTATLWQAIKARLASPRMLTILSGTAQATRIHLVTENYPAQEGPQGAVWGRVVVVPTQTLWQSGTAETASGLRDAGCLVRVECSHVEDAAFDPNVLLQAAQAEAYAQLQDWVPATPLTGVTVTLPFYRNTPPSDLPLWDQATGVWLTSAEYRTSVMRSAS